MPLPVLSINYFFSAPAGALTNGRGYFLLCRNFSSRGGGKGRATGVAAATGGNEDWELAQHGLKVWFWHFALPFEAQLCGMFTDSRFLPHFKLCEIRDPVGFPKLAKFLRNSDRDHRHLSMGIRGVFRAS